eukprot:Nk52_evm54s2039 gene=Nk52_evmTU54s2039
MMRIGISKDQLGIQKFVSNWMVIAGICLLFASLLPTSGAMSAKAGEQASQFFDNRQHTNNWAVLVDTSRFWFNYRHIANTLSLYRSVKRLGIPDSQIILMLADDMPCNPRNSLPATVYTSDEHTLNLYGNEVEVDYRGYEVTVENFLRLLTGRVHPEEPISKQLLTNENSNILIYMTGHGGEEFLKFQDAEEISSLELGDAFAQMWEKKRYNEILYIIDTCQAETMFRRWHSPNILAMASSKFKENSYSRHGDVKIGVSVIDRMSYHIIEVISKVTPSSKMTLGQMAKTFTPDELLSTFAMREDLYNRDVNKVPVTDFFGNVKHSEITHSTMNVAPIKRLHIDTNVSYVLDKDGIFKDSSSVLKRKTAFEAEKLLRKSSEPAMNNDAKLVLVVVVYLLLFFLFK